MSDLQEAQQQGAPPETLSKLQKALDHAQNDSDITDFEEDKAKVGALQKSVDQLGQINKDLVRFAVGKTVTLTTDGKPRQYAIQGPGHKFGSQTQAAVDGIALSYYMTSLTGDGFERGAWIEKTGDSWTYHDPQVGTVPTHTIHLEGITIPAGVPYIGLDTWSGGTPVAYFHIHPDNAILKKSENHDFSDRDKDAYSKETQKTATQAIPDHASIDAYLGGSDGSLRFLTGGSKTSTTLEPAGYFVVPHVN